MCAKTLLCPRRGMPVINRAKPTCAPDAFTPLSFKPGAVAPMSAFGDGYITRMTASMSGEDVL